MIVSPDLRHVSASFARNVADTSNGSEFLSRDIPCAMFGLGRRHTLDTSSVWRALDRQPSNYDRSAAIAQHFYQEREGRRLLSATRVVQMVARHPY